ncbi:arginine--tRNA ligase [Peptococcus simiae]|uniref:Arginine--tRNA ligase n=1 Tax=Peptococcus simiae TaxID=1643805 RepID=A0ABW9GZ01_9FIRM
MNIIADTKALVTERIEQAFAAAKADGVFSVDALPDFVVEQPNDKSHGDFATNIAMQLARPAKMNPRVIAQGLVERIDTSAPIDRVELAGPGFINFILKEDYLMPVLAAVQAEDTRYGASNVGQGRRVQVEFVSANPTGLLHMGNARGGALGDVLAAVLNMAGYRADKEYYINDTGNQVRLLGASVEARYFELLGRADEYPLPEDGYQGADIKETAQHLLDKEGEAYAQMDREDRLEKMTVFALNEKVEGIRRGLEAFGVTYDKWFSEKSLHESGAVQAVVDTLRDRGYVYEKDGAQWLRCTDYGAEKDEVLVRANGIPTYFAADIAYHKDKFDRGYEDLVNIWGADHHGHVARLKGALTALGYPGDRLTVILMQLVRLYRDGELVRMSKRAGEFVTLEELMEEVGREAARFFFSMRSPDSPLDFDLTLAKKQSSDNPVYYVQYAHARICSLLSVAGEKVRPAAEIDTGLLTHPAERALLEAIASWPEKVALAAQELAPYHLAYYAKDLANAFHTFYNGCKVLTDDAELQAARLVLADCARITLRNVLLLLGVSAPERM